MDFMDKNLIRRRSITNSVIERTCNTFDVNKKYYFGTNDTDIDIKYIPGDFPPYILRFPSFDSIDVSEYELCGPFSELLKFLSIHLSASVTIPLNKTQDCSNFNASSYFDLFINQVLFKQFML